jgi:hypothetical protein
MMTTTPAPADFPEAIFCGTRPDVVTVTRIDRLARSTELADSYDRSISTMRRATRYA